jgi:hypothetical protein
VDTSAIPAANAAMGRRMGASWIRVTYGFVAWSI